MSQPKRVEYYQVGSDGMVRNHDIDYSRGHGSLYVAACDYADLVAENERLKARVEFLEKADRFKIWNGKDWEIRFETPRP